VKRPLTEIEKIAVARMAEGLPEQQRFQITSDLLHATAEPLNDDGSLVRFGIEGYCPPTHTSRNVAVDAFAIDGDGAHLNVILFTDALGRLYELEIVRFEKGKLVGPDWSSLKYY
jgi:hypothetical protein